MEKERFIFDLDGTILKIDFSSEQEYLKSVLSCEDSLKFIPMIGKLLDEYENRNFKYDIFNLSRFLTEKSGVLITPDIIKGWNDSLLLGEDYLVDDIVNVFEYLKSKDKSIVVLTNWFLDIQKKRLDRCLLSSYFDGVYGGENGLKPFRESYYKACGDYSLEECVMIGDSLEKDVLSPMKYGIDAIYYNPSGEEVKVKSIRKMREIKEMF